MTNRLAEQRSLYLRQHATNPVDWWPWCPEAFAEARRRDVPVFVSIGYSSCHWCHVMAHESFEDPEIARLLNERFVNVKVDREECPDVDAVYMDAVQALTGHGGWPLSVFCTPDGRPFYGGTYWPPEPRHGMPSFRQVIDAVWEAWQQRRDQLEDAAARITAALDQQPRPAGGPPPDPEQVSNEAARVVIDRAWDRRWGGFGAAPKFPQPLTITWLLRRWRRCGDTDARDAALGTLEAMARGGIHDQVGGGFHRYSTDERWLVPHFEKMLYDNALLLHAYAEAAALAAHPGLRRVAQRTARFLLDTMRVEGGGFAAALDADSPGGEGRYYTWDTEEFTAVVRSLGLDPDRMAAYFGVTPHGNWEGTNILHLPVDHDRFCAARGLDPAAFAADVDRLLGVLADRRRDRPPPERDDKVVTGWNALAISALARGAVLLDHPDWLHAAVEAATYLRDVHVVDGRLHHVSMDGVAAHPALLEDVAAVAVAALDLYAVTGAPHWWRWATDLLADIEDRYRGADGTWYATPADAEALYRRPRDGWDGATPSGRSLLADAALRLAGYTGEARWWRLVEELVAGVAEDARRLPTAWGGLLAVVEALAAGPAEVAVVGREGPDRQRLLEVVWRRPPLGWVIAVGAPDSSDGPPLLDHRGEVDGRPAAYVCRRMVCDQPTTDPAVLAELLA